MTTTKAFYATPLASVPVARVWIAKGSDNQIVQAGLSSRDREPRLFSRVNGEQVTAIDGWNVYHYDYAEQQVRALNYDATLRRAASQAPRS